MDCIALGESLIDFVTIKGENPAKIYLEGGAGGAVANVMAMTAKLGRQAAFISKVGRDGFGEYIRGQIAASGVDVSAMAQGSELTTLAMVSLDKRGDRSFSFYRNQTADVSLQEYEVDFELIKRCRLFHFGSVSMTVEPSRGTTLKAAATAKEAGLLISFDPNYRPFLWDSADEALEVMRSGIELADFVKVSGEEAEMLTGASDPEKAALSLLTKYGLAFVAVTLGPGGCVGISRQARLRAPAYDVATIDTTGAGDAFWGAVLHRLMALEGVPASEEQMKDILNYGNAAGSLTTTAHGAIAPQPTEREILRCIREIPFLA